MSVLRQELKAGKSLSRILQNLALQGLSLGGDVLDVAGGKAPSYMRFLAVEPACRWTRADYNAEFDPDLVFDAGGPWPTTSAAYDHVVLLNCLYIFEEPIAVLEEAARCLRPGGRVLLSLPMASHELNEPTDYHRFTAAGARRLLERAGFEVERLVPYGGRVACSLEAVAPFVQRLGVYRFVAPVAAALDRRLEASASVRRLPALHLGFVAVGKKVPHA